MTSRVQNVRTVGVVLAITAQHQEVPSSKYPKPFTSAYIYSADYFSKGRFEVQASMPKGKLLLAQINLYEPQENDNTWVGIALVDFKQDSYFEVGVWETEGNFTMFEKFEHGANLSDFHVYAVERRKGHLRWFFDGYNFYNLSFTGIEPRLRSRLNSKMEIDVNLVVGGPEITEDYSVNDTETWVCPSLIVDYVRVFVSSNQADNVSLGEITEKSPSEICYQVQELNKFNLT